MHTRIAIFIDGNNFIFPLVKKWSLSSINIDNMINAFAKGRKVIRASFYCAPFDKNNSLKHLQHRFIDKVKKHKKMFFVKGYHKFGKEKETDINITVEMLDMAWRDQYDIAILITGDEDFYKVIRAVQKRKKMVELYIPRSSKSKKIRGISNTCEILDDYFPLFAKKKSRHR